MTFSEYKEKISIIQILEDLGYVPDITKGRVTPVYVKIINGQKVDEVMIKNPNSLSNQVYYDRKYQGGDVISFIKNHLEDFPQHQHRNQYIHINKVLSHYSKNTYIPKYKHFKLDKEHIPFEIERYKQLETKKQDLNYLIIERKIDSNVVEKFLPFITRVQDVHSKHKFSNIAFPYRIPGENWGQITNFEIKNYGFNGMAVGGDKTNSVWIANFASDDESVRDVFIAESAIDAMSFYELYQKEMNFSSSCFCSVGGYVTNNQIIRILKAFPKAQIHMCFDNDLAGILYDIRVHSVLMGYELKFRKEDEKTIFQVDNKEITLPNDELNLENFSKKMKDIILCKVHKSSKLYKDFNEELQQSKKEWKK